jgi:hypothetical protein
MSDADKLIPYPLMDKVEIRRHVTIDREWSLYALADLDDGMFEHCDWWALPGGLALVFRAVAIHPIFVLGDAVATKKLLAALPETAGYLNLKAHQLDAAEGIYRYRERHEMRRMFLDTFQPRSGITERLSAEDRSDIEHLYASGGSNRPPGPYALSSSRETISQRLAWARSEAGCLLRMTTGRVRHLWQCSAIMLGRPPMARTHR